MPKELCIHPAEIIRKASRKHNIVKGINLYEIMFLTDFQTALEKWYVICVYVTLECVIYVKKFVKML